MSEPRRRVVSPRAEETEGALPRLKPGACAERRVRQRTTVGVVARRTQLYGAPLAQSIGVWQYIL
jgi:hypothetical protein